MRRTEAREFLMQLFFQMEMQNDYSEDRKNRFVEQYMNGSDQLGYFTLVYTKTWENLVDIDKTIEAYSEKWKFNRIAKVDLAILRVALSEIFYIDDVPASVSINEAVEMAKKFSGEESGKFINGLLGRIMREKGQNIGAFDQDQNGNES